MNTIGNRKKIILAFSVIMSLLISGCIKEDLSYFKRKHKMVKVLFPDYGIKGSDSNPEVLDGIPSEDVQHTELYVINKNNVLLAKAHVDPESIAKKSKTFELAVPMETDTATILAWTRLNNTSAFLFKEPKIGDVIKDNLINLQKEIDDTKYSQSPPTLCYGTMKDVDFNKKDIVTLRMHVKTQFIAIETEVDNTSKYNFKNFHYEIVSKTNACSFVTGELLDNRTAIFDPNVEKQIVGGDTYYETTDNLVDGDVKSHSKEERFTILHRLDNSLTIRLIGNNIKPDSQKNAPNDDYTPAPNTEWEKDIKIDPTNSGNAEWANDWDDWQTNPGHNTLHVKLLLSNDGVIITDVTIRPWDIVIQVN